MPHRECPKLDIFRLPLAFLSEPDPCTPAPGSNLTAISRCLRKPGRCLSQHRGLGRAKPGVRPRSAAVQAAPKDQEPTHSQLFRYLCDSMPQIEMIILLASETRRRPVLMNIAVDYVSIVEVAPSLVSQINAVYSSSNYKSSPTLRLHDHKIRRRWR